MLKRIKGKSSKEDNITNIMVGRRSVEKPAMLFRFQQLFLLGGDWSDHVRNFSSSMGTVIDSHVQNNGGHWGNNSEHPERQDSRW